MSEVKTFKEHISENDMKKGVAEAIKRISRSAYFSPLYRFYPVLCDDECAKATILSMRADKVLASFDGNAVCLNTDEMRYFINLAWSKRGKKWLDDGYNVVDEVYALLVHEYTHILCQHLPQLREMAIKEPKYHTQFYYATEIEANRGFGIKKSTSIYQCAFTDDQKEFVELKGITYLYDIYEWFKKRYDKMSEKKKQMFDEALSEAMDELAREVDKAKKEAKKLMKGDGEGKGKKEGDNQNANREGSRGREADQSKEGQSQDGDGGSSNSTGSDGSGDGNGERRNDDDNSAGKRHSGRLKEGEPISDDDAGNSSDGSGSSSGGDLSAEMDGKDFKERLKQQLKKTLFNDALQGNMPNQPGFSDDRTEHNTYGDIDGSVGTWGGGSNTSGFPAHGSVKEKLTWVANQEKQRRLRDALKGIQGAITGGIVKERVYTYSRQSRKQYGGSDLIKRGTKLRGHKNPRLLIALDKSGSMSSTTMRQAADAIASVFEVCGRPTQGCYIVLHDGRCHGEHPFSQWKSVVNDYYPSGDNDFSEVVKLANKLKVDVVLNVGDGLDICDRDPAASREFIKNNRKWYDVNIVDESGYWSPERSVSEIANSYSRYGEEGSRIERHWIDLTGRTENSYDAYVVEE